MIESGNVPEGRTRQTISSCLTLQMGKAGFEEEGGIYLRHDFVPAPSSRIPPHLVPVGNEAPRCT